MPVFHKMYALAGVLSSVIASATKQAKYPPPATLLSFIQYKFLRLLLCF